MWLERIKRLAVNWVNGLRLLSHFQHPWDEQVLAADVQQVCFESHGLLGYLVVDKFFILVLEDAFQLVFFVVAVEEKPLIFVPPSVIFQ